MQLEADKGVISNTGENSPRTIFSEAVPTIPYLYMNAIVLPQKVDDKR